MNTLKQLLAVVAFLLVGVMGAPAYAQLSPEDALAARQAIAAWLECEECEEGQLEAVIKLGQVAVPSLAAALEKGPSPASLERLRLHLESNYKRIVEYSRTHEEVKIEFTSDEYVKIYTENYTANHGVRAAQALGKIGGEAARKVLDVAGHHNLREDVKRVVAEAAKGLGR